MTERVLVVGTGLIGGSIALALRKNTGAMVRGFDALPANAKTAMDLGALHDVVEELGEGAADADIVVVATPVGEVLRTIEVVAANARPGTIVTDVGSTKSGIVAKAEEMLGPHRSFVGGHPMAGTEGEGVASARGDLFVDALWILTPTGATDSDAYRRVNALVGSLGARTLALDPSEHDRLVALVSHLPYAIATALMAVAGDEGDPRVFRTAAGSFRDVTRTAGSNPTVWRDIFATNADAVVRELDQFGAMLDELRSALADARWDDLDALIERARSARKRFPPKGERTPAAPVTLEVGVPDRPGMFAEITTAIGEGGINIEDLWVDHTAVGGVLHVVVDGRETAEQAAAFLADRGFRTTVVEER